jgi:hypothetical protein
VEFPKEDDSAIILHEEMFRLITKGRHDYFEKEKKKEREHQERLREQKIAAYQAELAFEEREREVEWEHGYAIYGPGTRWRKPETRLGPKQPLPDVYLTAASSRVTTSTSTSTS